MQSVPNPRQGVGKSGPHCLPTPYYPRLTNGLLGFVGLVDATRVSVLFRRFVLTSYQPAPPLPEAGRVGCNSVTSSWSVHFPFQHAAASQPTHPALPPPTTSSSARSRSHVLQSPFFSLRFSLQLDSARAPREQGDRRGRPDGRPDGRPEGPGALVAGPDSAFLYYFTASLPPCS